MGAGKTFRVLDLVLVEEVDSRYVGNAAVERT